MQDDAYEPLWSYLEDVDMPFAVHPGISGLVPYDEIQARYDDYFSPLHATHFVTQQIMNLTTFIAYGILERHPRLRVAFLETGAVWAMSYVHRLDEHLELFGFDRGELTMKPSDYFRRQCFVSVEEVEPGLAVMLDEYPDSIVFSSDYPHADGIFPGSTKELLESPERDVLQKALARSNNTLAVAAKLLGVSRPTLYAMLETHGISIGAEPAEPRPD